MNEFAPPLRGLRGVDLTSGIAGPYCTKMLADAGVEIVKLEPAEGDPMRRYGISDRRPPDRDGALFEYLSAGKRSVTVSLASAAGAALLAGADLLVEDGLDDATITGFRATHPHLVIVSLRPFGRTGPYPGRAWTEFTLQALAGGIAGRGTADYPPLHVGGRLGEWIGGAIAAMAALAALRALERDGVGDHVDVSMLDSMAIMMSSYNALAEALEAPPPPSPRRIVELPSIEPTADGYVGFGIVTGQQFQDFLVMIERPDLIEDEGLARVATRLERREEFLGYVHAWTKNHTTAEAIELGTALRIPVTPIGTPETLTSLEQLVAREVFQSQPGSGFHRPRPPWLLDGAGPVARAAPALGADDGKFSWSPRPRASEVEGVRELPLAGVRVVDLTAFWAGPFTTFMLASLGADVVKVESPRRPDGMRMVSTKETTDPAWWEWGIVFQSVNLNKRAITLDLATTAGRDALLALVEDADLVVENFSPRVLENLAIDHDTLATVNPRVVTARMPAFGLDGPWRDRTGFAQTMEQVSGMAWMTGRADGPPLIPRGPCDPIAGTQTAFAIMAALRERDRRGAGFLLECAMVESALNVTAEQLVEFEAYGNVLRRNGNRGPMAAPQGVYPCAGDEVWLALAVQDDEQWGAFARVAGDNWATDARFATEAGRRAAADELDGLIARWTGSRDQRDLLDVLWVAGVPVAPVTTPEDVFGDPQIAASGIMETVEHPVIGRFDVFGLPFRFASRGDAGWIRRHAPLLGQHNAEVLCGELGMSAETMDELERVGVVAAELVT